MWLLAHSLVVVMLVIDCERRFMERRFIQCHWHMSKEYLMSSSPLKVYDVHPIAHSKSSVAKFISVGFSDFE